MTRIMSPAVLLRHFQIGTFDHLIFAAQGVHLTEISVLCHAEIFMLFKMPCLIL
jgi:hypothetical protein